MKEKIYRIWKNKPNLRPGFWPRLFLVALPPFIFCWPLNNGHPFPAVGVIMIDSSTATTTPLAASEEPKTFKIDGDGKPAGGGTVISRILGISTLQSMPVQLCLENNNVIVENEKIIENTGALIDAEEAGAVSFKLHDRKASTTEDIYIKRAEKAPCKNLTELGVELDKEFKFRNPVPLSVKGTTQPDGVVRVEMVKRDFRVRLSDLLGSTRILWSWKIFLSNLIITFFAWWLFLTSFLEILKFFTKDSKA